MVTILTATAVLALCTVVRWYLDRSARRDSEHFGGRVQLTVLWNEGAAFGLSIPKRVLMVLSVLCLGWLWALRKDAPLGAGLVLGGGASNLLERLKHGRVFDYIRFPKGPQKLRRYVYNLADFAVFLGGLFLLLGKRRK